MKRFIAVLLVVMMIFSFTACQGEEKNPDVNEIMKSIRQEIEFPEMAEIDLVSLNGYYELDTNQIEQVAFIIAGGGATADEVLIIKMKDGFDMGELQTKMETRKNMQTDLFSTYNPDENNKLSTAVIEIKGNYGFMAITNDNTKAKKAFNDAF